MTQTESPLQVLVVERDPSQREWLASVVHIAGYDVRAADTGATALKFFAERRPDIVLLAIDLPDITGKQLVEKLRQQPSQAPAILLLSAQHDVAGQRDCLQAGADDVLSTPVDVPTLTTKLHTLSRLALMQRSLNAQTVQLDARRQQEEQEAAAARYLYERLLTPPGRVYAGVHQWLLPARQFSGDMICSSIGTNGHIYLLLADATGHSLSATMALIPVTQVFYSMTGKGHHLSSIVREINRQVRQFTPRHHFVATVLVEIDPFQQQIDVWNGGMPTVLLWRRQAGKVRAFPSRHVAIGIDAESEFNGDVDYGQYVQGDQLLLFSDGLINAENAAGERFGMARIEQVFTHQSARLTLVRLQEALQDHQQSAATRDDIAIALVDLPDARLLEASEGNTDQAATLSPCSLQLSLQDRQIAQFDLLPMAVEWLRRVGLPQAKIARLHTVLMELVTNAIDHGLLKLDSTLKEQADGFSAYFVERNQRLQTLQHAVLKVSIQIACHNGRPLARIEVCDSGSGFDIAAVARMANDGDAIARRSGRGLQLIRLHCRTVQYSGNGNTVTAELDL